jgi:hypothetical protein
MTSLVPNLHGADGVCLVHHAVIGSVRFQALCPRVLIDGMKHVGVKRLLVVGGAGSLEVAPGLQLVDTQNFPEAYKSEALPLFPRNCLLKAAGLFLRRDAR